MVRPDVDVVLGDQRSPGAAAASTGPCRIMPKTALSSPAAGPPPPRANYVDSAVQCRFAGGGRRWLTAVTGSRELAAMSPRHCSSGLAPTAGSILCTPRWPVTPTVAAQRALADRRRVIEDRLL